LTRHPDNQALTLNRMKRQQATGKVEFLLQRLADGRHQWPLSMVTRVHVFGSYARGAVEPHDVDLVIETNRADVR
jgi:predicted nucleotidyltransferase